MGSKVVNFVALSLTAAALGAAAAYFTQSSKLNQQSLSANAKRQEINPATSTPISAMPVTAMPVTAMPVTAMPVTAMPAPGMPAPGMPVSGLGGEMGECDVQCGAEASNSAKSLGTGGPINSSGTPETRTSISDTEFSTH